MVLKTAYAVSWATITGHKDHSLCFEALQRAHPIMKWTRSHPEKGEPNKDNWTRDADRFTGACPIEVSEITHGRSVHFKVTDREALQSLLSLHQRYIGDPIRSPALTIGVEVISWYDGYSTRPAYWQDNTLQFAAKVFGIEYCPILYAAKKLRILYDKSLYGRYTLKGWRSWKRRTYRSIDCFRSVDMQIR